MHEQDAFYDKIIGKGGYGTVYFGILEDKVFTIPSGYRPSQDVFALCQGSNAAEWLLQVKTSGEVYFARYSDTTSFASIDTGKWFPFHVTWIMD